MNKLVSRWVNESMNERMNGWMNGWMSELLLCWATSSLGNLLWAASQLPLMWLLQSNSSLRAAVAMRLATQSAAIALAKSVAASLMLCCAQPCHFVLSQPVANPHIAGGSHWIDQRSRSADKGTIPRYSMNGVFLAMFNHFYVKPNSRYSFMYILPTSSSKSAPALSVFQKINLKCKSRSCHGPLHVFDDGWLTWWCGCHDETWTWWQDCPWTFVRNSEVFLIIVSAALRFVDSLSCEVSHF